MHPPVALSALYSRRAPGQTLFFDADDTLWENNLYFEQAIASFTSFLDHRSHTPAEVRAHLDACERQTIAAFGYGTQSFRRSLLRCFEQLSGASATAVQQARIASFAEAILEQDIELRNEVEPTLHDLATRHRLVLVTKGDRDEQTGKLARSGLGPLFSGVEVPTEKDEGTYRSLLVHYACDPATTWMIGNSPRSDINPALAAGLNAIFLPHPITWALEHDQLHSAPADRTLLELAHFSDLRHLL